MSVVARYRTVLTPAGVRDAFLASILGRVSLGMNGLALLLLVRAAGGSYAAAGAVAACYAVAFAAVAPTRARSADRSGPRPVLRLTGLTHPLAYAVVVGLAKGGAPTWSLALAAVGIGATVPPLGSVMRALWGHLVDEDALPAAYSLDSVAVELCFVCGPLLVGLLAATVEPAAAVLASALCGSAAALVLAASPAVGSVVPHPDRVTSLAGPLVSPMVRACLLNVLGIGVGFGTIEVGVLAFLEEHGSGRAAAGVVLAVWSLGSMAGGLLYGGLHPAIPAHRQLPWLVAAVGVGACLPVLSTGAVALGALLFVSGSTIAPFSACNSVILGGNAPPGTVTEAFAWNGSMIFGGAAAGTAVAGLLVDRVGARGALVATAVTGALVILSGWRSVAALRAHLSG